MKLRRIAVPFDFQVQVLSRALTRVLFQLLSQSKQIGLYQPSNVLNLYVQNFCLKNGHGSTDGAWAPPRNDYVRGLLREEGLPDWASGPRITTNRIALAVNLLTQLNNQDMVSFESSPFLTGCISCRTKKDLSFGRCTRVSSAVLSAKFVRSTHAFWSSTNCV